ncbi:MAG TPA: SGNH/GDSL hydrolase family protein [Armatimonadota bacterium]|jgi:lysophospholipase L1-like esterase
MADFALQPGARVLFQGDSITDAGRSRDNDAYLGAGYASFVAAWLSSQYPEHHLTFLNRGISGNTVPNLEARWTEDCITLQPDWLSILIGINDTARNHQDQSCPVSQFEPGYRSLLDRVNNETKARLILIEPFLLPSQQLYPAWRPGLEARINIVRQLAREYNALYVPLDGMFAVACTRAEPAYWSGDGVHPSPAGHALMAQAWMAAVGA